jgi:hypothetical protein
MSTVGPRLPERLGGSRLPAGATKNRGPDPAHGGVWCGGFPPALAHPGRRSPVDVATERRHPSRGRSAVEEIHCLCLILLSLGAPSPGDGRSPGCAGGVYGRDRRTVKQVAGGCRRRAKRRKPGRRGTVAREASVRPCWRRRTLSSPERVSAHEALADTVDHPARTLEAASPSPYEVAATHRYWRDSRLNGLRS